jgi:peptidoglycan/xylan/chitin deacetylase (PgdA/CDA1 family)
MVPRFAMRNVPGTVARALVQRWADRIRLPADPWDGLNRELDQWRGGTPACVWWRDDDAVAATPALDRLLALRTASGVPLALAVIPAQAQASLAAALAPHQEVAVLAHGWDHADHAISGGRAELAAHRPAAEVASQLAAGRDILRGLFGGQQRAVLVPPFNTLASGLMGAVRQAGFRYVSVDRDFRNTHLDVIDWGRSAAADPASLIRIAIAALRLRRLGLVPRQTPVGVLTHHLVHDAATWELTGTLLRRLTAHRAVATPPLDEIFP